MRTTWSSYSNPRLVFGPGALNQVGQVVSRLGGARTLLITDPIMEGLGVVERVASVLKTELKVYAKGEIEPSTDAVSRCAALAREFNPDVTVAIGGGSNMDLAKLTCATVSSGKEPASMLGFDAVPGPIGNLVCIPTTAGTGSEASHSAVICNSDTGMKVAALSHYLRPQVAIVDPELTLSCPKKLTADSGIDALSHAIEGYLATDFSTLETNDSGILAYEGNHPIGDLYSEKCIRLISEHFLKAVHEPSNIEARSGMALAATLGGLAFSNCGVALVHALAYPIGNRYKSSHGAGNGIALPEVMRFLKGSRAERLARIGALLGVDADAAIEEVIRLRKEADLPERIADVGGRREDLPELAATAFKLEPLMALSPAKVDEQDLLAILEASF